MSPECHTLGFLSTCLTGHRRRSRGHPGKNWMKCLLEDAAAFSGNTDIDLEGASEMVSDCKHWKEMINHKWEFISVGHSND